MNALPPPQIYLERGKNVSLKLQSTKKLHGTRNIVVLDSGSFVLQGLVCIKKKGVYGEDPIKKMRYWPHYIDGETIKDNFTNKGVGAVDSLRGELENVTLCVFSVKD